jgi:hypothetical protein
VAISKGACAQIALVAVVAIIAASLGAAGPSVASAPPGSPQCTITSPVNGSRVGGRIAVLGTAVNGSLPLGRVQVRIDGGNWTDAAGFENWTLLVDTTRLANGKHSMDARATDANGASDPTTLVVVVRNPEPAVSSRWDTWCLVTSIIAAGAVAIIVLLARGGGKR